MVEFDPLICGTRLFLIKTPKFIKRLEAEKKLKERRESSNGYGTSKH